VNREQLEHAVRSAAEITGDRVVLVIGSQSILGSFDEYELPQEACQSMEIDIGFFTDPGGSKADAVEGACGEDTQFYRSFRFFVDGVDVTTATLPHGWWDRLVEVSNSNTNGARGQCLEPHDCVLSKLVAGREKDLVFAGALLDARLVNPDVLIERVPTMDISPMLQRRIISWVDHWGRR
jgi:hypothetical protein